MPSLYEMLQQQEEEARLSNEQRKAAIEEIFDKVISMYSKGGSFGAGYEEQLEAQKVQDVSKSTQQGISSGLYGLRNYGQEWESTVGTPARLKLEDIRMERLSSAMTSKAGFLENIEEPYPDYSSLLQAGASSYSTPRTYSRTIGRTYGASSFPDQFSIAGGRSSSNGTDIGYINGRSAQPAATGQPAYTPQSSGDDYFNMSLEQLMNVPVSTSAGTETTSPTDAIKKYATYEEFASWAKGQGMKPGSKEEWQSVKKRIG